MHQLLIHIHTLQSEAILPSCYNLKPYQICYLYTSNSYHWTVSIAGPGKTDISAVPNMYQTINSCYGQGAATVNS